MTTEFIVKFFGLLGGVLARSLLPWLRKLRDGEPLVFDRRYLISAIASFILSFIVSLIIFPQFPATASPSDPNAAPSFEDYFKLFCLAFGFGFGFDALFKEAGQWARLYRKKINASHHQKEKEYKEANKYKEVNHHRESNNHK